MNRLLVLAFLGLPGLALAHPMADSVVLLDVHERTVQAEVQIPLSQLGLALTLREDLMGDPDAVLAAYGARFRAYLPQHVQPLTPSGEPWAGRVDDLSVRGAEQTATGPYQSGTRGADDVHAARRGGRAHVHATLRRGRTSGRDA